MKTYTPAELRDLADSRRTNPFFSDEARAALHYAANVIEAADAAVTAERQRAEQGDAKDARLETMEIRYETYGNCLWHTDCKVNSFKSGIMQVLSHEAESSTMKCLHCGQVGAYPKGRVGTVCVPVISTDAAILASKPAGEVGL